MRQVSEATYILARVVLSYTKLEVLIDVSTRVKNIIMNEMV